MPYVYCLFKFNYVILRYVILRNLGLFNSAVVMTNIRNPFILTPYVPEDLFCDRRAETEQLCKHMLNGRNVALFANRRLGKTGLIRHCFEQKQIVDHFNTFLVDIYSAGNLQEMATLFAKEVFSKVHMLGLKDKILNGLKYIQPTIGYNELTATYSFGVGMAGVREPQRSLEEILSVLDSLNKPSIVAIDEFQTIREFKEENAEAFLRTAFQRCKNVYFIYTGSIGHSMTNIFKSPDKPFYNSAVMMTIDVIDRDVYRDFAIDQFHKYNKDIDPELVNLCYDYFGGITWYNQLLMNEAFAQTEQGGVLRASDFDSIYDAIIAQQAFAYQELFARFSSKQRAVLLSLAYEGKNGAQVTSEGFLQKYGLGAASSVQTACSALKKHHFITDEPGNKRISDLIFLDWLRRQ